MTTLNDEKLRALRSALGVVNGGSIDALELEYLHTVLLATADNVNDAWVEVFRRDLSRSDGQFNDLSIAWLENLGHLQNDLNAAWFAYWSGVS